jgi:hypothetical protein
MPLRFCRLVDNWKVDFEGRVSRILITWHVRKQAGISATAWSSVLSACACRSLNKVKLSAALRKGFHEPPTQDIVANLKQSFEVWCSPITWTTILMAEEESWFDGCCDNLRTIHGYRGFNVVGEIAALVMDVAGNCIVRAQKRLIQRGRNLFDRKASHFMPGIAHSAQRIILDEAEKAVQLIHENSRPWTAEMQETSNTTAMEDRCRTLGGLLAETGTLHDLDMAGPPSCASWF